MHGLSPLVCFHTKMIVSHPLDITFQNVGGKMEGSEAIMENAHFFKKTEACQSISFSRHWQLDGVCITLTTSDHFPLK